MPPPPITPVFDLISHTDSTSLTEHSCGNVHTCQFLEEKLGGIGEVDLGNFCLVLAGSAFEEVLFEVSIYI
jgi:hypothetical protein